MKKLKVLITAVLLINSFSFASFSQDLKKISTDVNQYIEKNKDFINSSIAIKVRNLDKKQDLYSYNADKLMTPASNTKILTTFLALQKLGADFSFITELATDGYHQISDNLFYLDNLYVNLSGDPTFTNKTLQTLIEKLKDQGITEIKNDVIIEKSSFDNIIYGPGWMWDDLNDCDDSPISPIYMDDNCLRVKITEKNNSFNISSPNHIKVDTADLKISTQNQENEVKVENFDDSNTLYLSGYLGTNNSYEIEQSITNHEKYFTSVLYDILQKEFNFSGKVIVSNTKNKETIALVTNASVPLKDILKKFNKDSHNLTGELILKTTALSDSGEGSTKKGTILLKKELDNLFPNNKFNIVDGSGLSRYNLITPNLLVSVLDYLYKSQHKETVFSAFPIGGLEGTLKNRLKNLKNYKVVAKSGSMTGINCLSGYLSKKGKDTIAFSIMINNSNLSPQNLRDIQDKILGFFDN